MRPVALVARFIALYAALYAAFGIISPFLPGLLQHRGLGAEEIGSVMALGVGLRLVAAPLAGRLADRTRAPRVILCASMAIAGATVLLYLPASGFWPVLAVASVQAVALAPLPPLADAITVSAANSPKTRFEYGWVRGAGSAAFVVALVASGYGADALGINSIIWANAVMLVAATFAALAVPEIASEATAAQCATGFAAFAQLLGIAHFRRLLLLAALILGSHALHDTFAVILWQSRGIARGTAGLLWSGSVASEVLIFFLVGPWLLERFGPAWAAAVAASAGTVRWAVLATSSDVIALALAEPLHGLSFALLHLAAMKVITASVPLGLAATAQAIYGTLAVGATTALLTLASGWLYDRMAGGAFWVMAALCAAAIPLAAGLRGSRA